MCNYQVKRFSGDASDLGLDFTVEADLLGKHVVEELVAGGSDKTVTNENKLQYVHLMADWHVNVKVGRPAQAFAAGFAEVLPLPWLRYQINWIAMPMRNLPMRFKNFLLYISSISMATPLTNIWWVVGSSVQRS